MSDTPKVWTVLSMLKWTTSYFDEKKVPSPRLSIEWLLANVMGKKRLDLYLCYDQPLTSEELAQLRPLVKRRAEHEPLQYILGETEFYQARIKVNPSVLIPRPETEELVDIMLKRHDALSSKNVLDIGTGSGCIPIALKLNRPSWKVSAFDISDDALSLAKENAILNEVEVSFWRDDIFGPSAGGDAGKFDLIISNPPYINRNEMEALDDEVKKFEPHLALFCESTEKMYGAIEEFCSQNLAENGIIYLEIHSHHGEDCEKLFSHKQWTTKLIKDLDEKDRFLVAKK